MTEPILSIVIPTQKKRVESLGRLLNSIKAQGLSREQLEVIVVSSDYSDEIDKVVSFYKADGFSYFQTNENGVNKMRNYGYSKARAGVIYFLDDDCLLPSSDFLRKKLLWHRMNPMVAGVGGYYLQMNSKSLISLAYQLISRFWIVLNKVHSNTPWQLYGGNASYKKCFLPEEKPFNEKIIFGGTEEDFNQTLVSQGHNLKIIATHSVYHDVQLSLKDLCRKAFWQGHSFGERKHNETQAELPYFKETISAHINANYRGYSRHIIIFYVWLYNYFFHFGSEYYLVRLRNAKKSLAMIFLGYFTSRFFWPVVTSIGGLFSFIGGHSYGWVLRLRTLILEGRDSVLWRFFWPVVTSIGGLFSFIGGHSYGWVLRLRTLLSRTKNILWWKLAWPLMLKARWAVFLFFNFLWWKLTWPASFPIRKIYYFIEYQIYKKHLKDGEGSRSLDDETMLQP